MTKFEVGRRYYCRLVTDYDTVLVYRVVKRTERFITVERADESEPEPKRLGVRTFEGVEVCNPWGRYSMAPVLRADREQVLVCPYCGDPDGVDSTGLTRPHSCS